MVPRRYRVLETQLSIQDSGSLMFQHRQIDQISLCLLICQHTFEVHCRISNFSTYNLDRNPSREQMYFWVSHADLVIFCPRLARGMAADIFIVCLCIGGRCTFQPPTDRLLILRFSTLRGRQFLAKSSLSLLGGAGLLCGPNWYKEQVGAKISELRLPPIMQDFSFLKI